MSGSLNQVTLIGHLGKDPEIRSFQNGDRVANFSLATSESWKDKKSGEKKERTEWHRVSIISDGLAGIAEKYLKKGSKVYVQGRLETRKWTDRDNVERYTTEVVLRPYAGELLLLDRKDDASDAPGKEDIPPHAVEPPPAEEAQAAAEQPANAKKRAGQKG
jgi:single-strand DNA-binding protein